MRLFDLRLRYWAYRQFMYELENDPRDSEDAEDFASSRRQFFWRSVILGHVDDRAIVTIEDDFPQLADPEVLASDVELIGIARLNIERYLQIGEKRSGFLAGFLRAQRDHLLACARCRASVCAAIRKDVGTGRRVREIFDGLSPDDRQRLAEEFAPAAVRRRNDPSVN